MPKATFVARTSSWYTRVFGTSRTTKWLVCLILGYCCVLGYIVLERYYSFETRAFDLGIFNQAFSTALQGKLFYETPDDHLIPSGSFLGTHFNLLMFILLPIYAVYPHPQTLLILQTLVVAAAALPIYLIARKVTSSDPLALVLAAVYLVNPATVNMNLYDFHLEAFLPFFLCMFFYCYLVSNWRGYAVFLVLSLITIDFAPVLVMAICLAHFLRGISISRENGTSLALNLDRRRLKILLATALGSLAVFYLWLRLSVVFAGTSVSVQGIITSFISPAQNTQVLLDKSEFWVIPLATLMFLPLLSLGELIMVAPWFLVTILEGPYSTSYGFGYQYAGAFVFPFLLIATTFSIQKLRIRKANIKGFLIGIFILSLLLLPYTPVTTGRISGLAYQQSFPAVNSQDAILDKAISLIPANASVLTQNDLFPQLSGRADAYIFLTSNKTSVQYVLADATSSSYTSAVWGIQSMKAWIPYFLSTGHYGYLVNDDGVILLQANYTGSPVLQGPITEVFDYQSLDLRLGTTQYDASSTSGTILVHTPSDGNGTFWFGPYATLPPGEYSATFVMMSGQGAKGSLNIEVADFVNATSEPVISLETITPGSFPAPSVWTSFTLTFNYSPQQSALGRLEFRGVDVSGGTFYLDYIKLVYVGPYQQVSD